MKKNARKVLRFAVGVVGSEGTKKLFEVALKKAVPLVVVVAAPVNPPTVVVLAVGLAGGFAARKVFDHLCPPS